MRRPAHHPSGTGAAPPRQMCQELRSTGADAVGNRAKGPPGRPPLSEQFKAPNLAAQCRSGVLACDVNPRLLPCSETAVGVSEELTPRNQSGLSFAREIIERNQAPRHHHHQSLCWTRHLRSLPMGPVHIDGRELQPGDALLCTEYMDIVLDEVRNWNEMCRGQIAFDAERSTHVLTMDEDMHQAPDRPSPSRRVAVGSGVPKGLQNDRWVLLTAYLPVSRYPSVVVEAVAKHSTEDRANSEGTLRTCGHVSEHVSDAPLGTQ